MPAVPAAYPPNVLQADPLALYGRTDSPGAGPLELVQTNPRTGDTVARNSAGEWVNVNALSAAGYPIVSQEGASGRPARANVVLPAAQLVDEAAALITKEAVMVWVPVAVGDVITKVSVLAGHTESGTLSHAWAALYKGELESSEGVILGEQSTDLTSGTIKKEAVQSFTLGKPVTITAAMAPKGGIWAAVGLEATVPSLLGVPVATIGSAYLAPGAPPALAYKFSVTGTAGVAKTPTGTLTAMTVMPVVILS